MQLNRWVICLFDLISATICCGFFKALFPCVVLLWSLDVAQIDTIFKRYILCPHIQDDSIKIELFSIY